MCEFFYPLSSDVSLRRKIHDFLSFRWQNDDYLWNTTIDHRPRRYEFHCNFENIPRDITACENFTELMMIERECGPLQTSFHAMPWHIYLFHLQRNKQKPTADSLSIHYGWQSSGFTAWIPICEMSSIIFEWKVYLRNGYHIIWYERPYSLVWMFWDSISSVNLSHACKMGNKIFR